jgi:CRP-like cAMP-binding protein
LNLFPTVTEEEAKNVFTERRTIDPNELIFAEGDRGDGVYFILEGKAKAVTSSTTRSEIVLGELNRGEIFGEMALIDDKPRSASVITVTPCKIAFITKKDFNEFIEAHSELAYRLISLICLSLFRRILRLDKAYADIKQHFHKL